VLINSRQKLVIKISSFLLQLSAGQVTQVVVGLANQLLGVQECVNEQAATTDLPWHPTVEPSVELSLWHLSSLHATKTRPVIDPQVADPCKQDFDHAAAKVVRDQQIWIDQMQLVDEHLEHLALVLEYLNVSVSLLLDLLLQIERQWLRVQLPQQCEALEFFISRGAILINLVLHDARDDSDLLSILL